MYMYGSERQDNDNIWRGGEGVKITPGVCGNGEHYKIRGKNKSKNKWRSNRRI